MKVALDTNAYAALFRGNQSIAGILDKATQVILPFFVYAELLTGFNRGSATERNLADLEEFLSQPKVSLPMPSKETAEYFSFIRCELLQKGTPIPINDVWIAAQVMETGSALLSFDEHFKKVTGLRLAT